MLTVFLPNLQMGATPSDEAASTGPNQLMLMGVGRAIIIGFLMTIGATKWV